MPLNVGIFSRDPIVRFEAARAFDAAPSSWIVRLYDRAPEDVDVVVFGSDVACTEGIVFDPAHPDRVIDEVVHASESSRGCMVLVTSPSGGTGVTTVALHLARALPGACMVDLDPAEGARYRLGLDDSALGCSTTDGASEVVDVALPVAAGFRVLLKASALERATRVESIMSLRTRYEHVVIDGPRGSLDEDLLDVVDTRVMVMAPTMPCVEMAGRMPIRDTHDWAFVFNRSGPGGEITDRVLSQRLGHRIACSLPCTPSLRDREDEAALLRKGWTRWERSMSRLAEGLRAR